VPLGAAIFAAASCTTLLNDSPFRHLRQEVMATIPYAFGVSCASMHAIQFPWGEESKTHFHVHNYYSKIIEAQVRHIGLLLDYVLIFFLQTPLPCEGMQHFYPFDEQQKKIGFYIYIGDRHKAR